MADEKAADQKLAEHSAVVAPTAKPGRLLEALPQQLEVLFCSFLPIVSFCSLYRVSRTMSKTVVRVLTDTKALIFHKELSEYDADTRFAVLLAVRYCRQLRVLQAAGPRILLTAANAALLDRLIAHNQSSLRDLTASFVDCVKSLVSGSFPELERFIMPKQSGGDMFAIAFTRTITRKKMPKLLHLAGPANVAEAASQGHFELLSLDTRTANPRIAVTLIETRQLHNLHTLGLGLQFSPSPIAINRMAAGFACMHALTDLSLEFSLGTVDKMPAGEVVPWKFPALRSLSIHFARDFRPRSDGLYLCPSIVSATAQSARVSSVSARHVRCEIIRDLLLGCSALTTIDFLEPWPDTNEWLYKYHNGYETERKTAVHCALFDAFQSEHDYWPALTSLNCCRHCWQPAHTDPIRVFAARPRLELRELQCYALPATTIDAFLAGQLQLQSLVVVVQSNDQGERMSNTVRESVGKPWEQPKPIAADEPEQTPTKLAALLSMELTLCPLQFRSFSFTNLTTLSLTLVALRCGLDSILRACPSLQQLHLQRVALTSWQTTVVLPSLTRFSIGYTALSFNPGQMAAVLKAFPNVREFALSGSVPAEFFEVFASELSRPPLLQHLTHLSYRGGTRNNVRDAPAISAWQLLSRALPGLVDLTVPHYTDTDIDESDKKREDAGQQYVSKLRIDIALPKLAVHARRHDKSMNSDTVQLKPTSQHRDWSFPDASDKQLLHYPAKH